MQLTNAAVDVETTGLISGLNEIVQLSIAVYGEEYTVIDKLDMYMRPMHPELVDEEALKINKLSMDFLMKQQTPIQAKNVLYQWINERKIFPLGFNYSFDKEFLRLFLGDKYDEFFHYKFRDAYIIAQFLKDSGKLKCEGLKLTQLSEHFKIPHKEHDAISDCVTTIRLYQKLLEI